MRIGIRADSSSSMGTGHVLRCLNLAKVLKEKKGPPVFFSQELPGNLINEVRSQGFHVQTLHQGPDPNIQTHHTPKSSDKYLAHTFHWETDVEQTINFLKHHGRLDWIITDHYGCDHRWHNAIKPYTERILAIDDLANRNHVCDILLDQNYFSSPQERYKNKIPENCQLLLGPQYALLNRSFHLQRTNLKTRNFLNIRRILVSYGGNDATSETEKSLSALNMLGCHNLEVLVVMGKKSKSIKPENFPQLESKMKIMGFIDNMAEIMAQSDLAIGTGGVTLWERCCLGIPSILTSVALNQEETLEELHQAGIVLYLGKRDNVSPKVMAEKILHAFKNPELLISMSHKSLNLTDGNGAERVALKIVEREQK